MKKEQRLTKRIIFASLLVGICVALSLVDRLICSAAFPFLPVAKIGLANIIIVFSLYKLKITDVFIIVILKSILVGLLLGGPITFVISLSSSLASLIVMIIMLHIMRDKVSCVSISLLGGITHIVVQLFVVAIIYKIGTVVIYYGLLLVITSFITSIIIGLINNMLLNYEARRNHDLHDEV